MHLVLLLKHILLMPPRATRRVARTPSRHRSLLVPLPLPLHTLAHLLQPLVQRCHIALVLTVSKIGAGPRKT